MTLILTNKKNYLKNFENKNKYSEYTSEELSQHQDVFSNFLNVGRRQVNFSPLFYGCKSTEWLMFDDQFYADNSLLKLSIKQPAYFLLARLIRFFGIKYGARKSL